MGEIQIRAVLPGEYQDTGSLTQRAYAEYARPGDPLWDDYFGLLADVSRRARFATVLAAGASSARPPSSSTGPSTGPRACSPARPTSGCWPWTPGPGDAAWAGGSSKRASRSPGAPGRRSLRCTLIWSCKPSGFHFSHRTEKARIMPGILGLAVMAARPPPERDSEAGAGGYQRLPGQPGPSPSVTRRRSRVHWNRRSGRQHERLCRGMRRVRKIVMSGSGLSGDCRVRSWEGWREPAVEIVDRRLSLTHRRCGGWWPRDTASGRVGFTEIPPCTCPASDGETMETSPGPWIGALRRSHDRLRALVEPLDSDNCSSVRTAANGRSPRSCPTPAPRLRFPPWSSRPG